jgi:hypothetical protein
LWPPQRGLGSLEPNLGKTNHRVIRSISLVDLFSSSLLDSDLFLTLTPACSLSFKVINFRFAYSHPSRRLSISLKKLTKQLKLDKKKMHKRRKRKMMDIVMFTNYVIFILKSLYFYLFLWIMYFFFAQLRSRRIFYFLKTLCFISYKSVKKHEHLKYQFSFIKILLDMLSLYLFENLMLIFFL